MSVDLTTTYLGLKLKNPLVIGACPLTEQLETLRRLEAAGAAAAVLPSLFEEQIEHDQIEMARVQDFHTESFAESLTYFPEQDDYHAGPEGYLDYIGKAKRAVKIPVIASLNGTSVGGWTRYAKMMQDAGADALELNIYFVAADVETTADEVEARYLELVAAVKQTRVDPPGGEGRPLLQRHGEHGAAVGRRGGRRPGALQPLPPAGHRPGDAGDDAAAGPEQRRSRCSCPCGGSPSCTAASTRRWR